MDARVVRWKSPNNSKQWHYGIVMDEDGDILTVEYTHSVPTSNLGLGMVVNIKARQAKDVR